MSLRSIFSVTNLAFLAGGVYFAAIAASQEATIYTAIVAVLCFVSVLFSLRESFHFSGPWRVASSVAVLVLLAGQEIASFRSGGGTDAYSIGVVLLNGALLVVFLGVLLSSSREVTRQETKEEAEEREEAISS